MSIHHDAVLADVKPTNVLVSKSGNIKLCDFGVSAQMERSLAKTNIGCQSYMAVSWTSFLEAAIFADVIHVVLVFSLSASKANRKAMLALTRLPPMFGPWVSP